MMGFTREEVCEINTNKLSLKKARKILAREDFFEKMLAYQIHGPKKKNFRDYEKISFLKANLVIEEDKSVAEYSQAMNKLRDWILLAIELRCHDVVTRKNEIEKLIYERNVAVEKSEARANKLEAALEEAKEKHIEEWNLE